MILLGSLLMTAIAERISQELLSLSQEEQNSILNEVREKLQDLRAKKVYEAVKSGEMETHDSQSVFSDMRKKYGL